MTNDQIPIAGPWITEHEVNYVADAATNGWYHHAGDHVRRFEESFAAHTGRAWALSTPSCTSAIHLALSALGVGPGDEVIVPDITWIASAAPISYVGAKPVFADVDRSTWCISPDAVRKLVCERTKAIIAVDLYGGMPQMDLLLDLAGELEIPVIEDAAEAIGSMWNERPAGSFGKTSVFSFHGSKTLTTGEGGMALTDDEELYRRMAQLADHGRPPGDTNFINEEVAFKYKMSALQAAFGLAQLERLPDLVGKKRQLFDWYRDRLQDCDGILSLNAEPKGTFNSYWMVTALFDDSVSVSVPELRAELAAFGIDTRPFFQPLSSLPAYTGTAESDRARERNLVAYDLAPRGINLPSALSLSEAQVERVAFAIRKVLNVGRSRPSSQRNGPGLTIQGQKA